MASSFAALNNDEKQAVIEYVQAEYERVCFIADGVQPDPENWKACLRELIASDCSLVRAILQSSHRNGRKSGFTLIELSIVLVIIGLIVGGVLVGQDLIRAAEVRATITQIEKYNTAVNTFRGKYDALPGDMNARSAASFGFPARGTYAGEGDGNGVVEGVNSDAPGQNQGTLEATGEVVMFWVDLSQAHLIDGRFSAASSTANPSGPLTPTSSPNLGAYFPQAKLGRGNYIYVWSGGMSGDDGINYFGLSAWSSIQMGGAAASSPGLTVQQAYSIDKKMDDGLAQAGNVTANYLNDNNAPGVDWAAGGGNMGAATSWNYGQPTTAATAGSSTTCYDNGNVGGAAQQYSVAQNGGAGMNCALSFRFQ